MTLQTGELAATVLAVIDDVPGTGLQPQLVDGMHLRWASSPARGFPWFGYYVFRRDSQQDAVLTCLAPELAMLGTGVLDSLPLVTSSAEWSSDRRLVVTRDFSAAAELDLAARSLVRVRLRPDLVAASVTARIGFRHPSCRTYSTEAPRTVSCPWQDGERRITVFDGGSPAQAVELVDIGDDVGVQCGTLAEVALATPSDGVSLRVRSPAAGVQITGLDANQNQISSVAIGASSAVVSVQLPGAGIQLVRLSLPAATVTLHRFCANHGDKRQSVTISLRSGGHEHARRVVEGDAGDVVNVSMTATAVDEIQVSAAAASLMDLCIRPVADGAAEDWESVDITYPLALPVAHADYPCRGAPPDLGAAEQLALDRIRYGDRQDWAGDRFQQLHDVLVDLVVDGPAGVPMADRSSVVDSFRGPRMPRQRPYDLVMLGALDPAVAQMLGLYVVDEKPVEDDVVDYLILADHDGVLGGSAASALAWIAANPTFDGVDATILLGCAMTASPPLAPPTDVRAFALPGGSAARPDGTLQLSDGMVGLRWHLELGETGKLLRGAAVSHHVWRVDLGNTETASEPAPPESMYARLSGPATVVTSSAVPPAVVPPGWPTERLFVIDSGLTEGWYSYGIGGIDLFGRHSVLSEPGQWWQWSPAPAPLPWYYELPEAPALVHAYAVRILDKLAPPAPILIDASALDPADPLVVQDAAYLAWRAALPAAVRETLIGMRVRWRWTAAQHRVAPDVHEFRIYLQPGRFADHLQARDRANWERRLHVVGVGDHSADEVVALDLGDATSLAGTAGTISGADLVLDGDPPLGAIRPGLHSLAVLEGSGSVRSFHEITAVATSPARVTLAPPVAAGPPVSWVIGLRSWTYDAFWPPVGATTPSDLPLEVSLAEPVVYADVGVSAADARAHSLDDPRFPPPVGPRPGNEGPVAGPAVVYLVRRTAPPPPVIVADSEALVASPADYHGRSFFSLRWPPLTHTRVHVLRALDEAVFVTDRALRPRGPLSPSSPVFPVEALEPRWTPALRAQVAAELDALDGFDTTPEGERFARQAYRTLSNDALRVLATLPGTEQAFTQRTAAPLDPDDPATANRRGPDGGRRGHRSGAARVPRSARRSFAQPLPVPRRLYRRRAQPQRTRDRDPAGRHPGGHPATSAGDRRGVRWRRRRSSRRRGHAALAHQSRPDGGALPRASH